MSFKNSKGENKGENMRDIILTAMMFVLINGWMFLEENFNLGKEEENGKRKIGLPYLPKTEKFSTFSDKNKGRVNNIY